MHKITKDFVKKLWFQLAEFRVCLETFRCMFILKTELDNSRGKFIAMTKTTNNLFNLQVLSIFLLF